MFSFCSHEPGARTRRSTSHLGAARTAPRESKGLWGSSSEAYFRVDKLLRQLANPNLHDIPTQMPFRVELWDRSDRHIRWVIAATSSIAIGHAALDAAIANYRDQRFTLRNGILVIREHAPKGSSRRSIKFVLSRELRLSGASN